MTGNIKDTDGGIASEQKEQNSRMIASRAGRSVLRMGFLIGVLLLAGSLFVGVAAADPVEISTWSELQDIEDDLDGDYVLIADLDANTEDYAGIGDDFQPIGPSSTNPFTGEFDGNGHAISDIVIDTQSARVGFVGYSEGTLHQVALENATVSGGIAGSLVGQMNDGKISESYVTGEVTGGTNGGGLIGWGSAGEINASYAIVDASEQAGGGNVGGLVARVTINGAVNISESYAAGSVTGNTRGGLIGDVGDSATVDIKNTYWDTEVAGTTSAIGSSSGDVTTTSVNGLSSDELKGDAAVTNMDGFDFDATWAAETGDIVSYPYLQSTPQDPTPGRENTRFAGGLGTADDPLQIETWEHLHRVGESLDAHFELIGDLDQETDGYEEYVTGPSEGFEPIGSEADPFTGTFDGSGHVIDGLYIEQNGDHVGLFSSVGSTGHLTHVGLDAVDVTGDEYVGGLVGESAGEIDQSWVSGNVTGSVAVGGLVGHTEETVAESYAVGTVTGESTVGGLVGYTEGTVVESYAVGTVTGDSTVGGFVGHTEGTVAESYAEGTVTGESTVGGLVGYTEGTVAESYAEGTVTGESTVGGLAGHTEGTVAESYAVGTVTGDATVGGLVGSIGSSGDVSESYAASDIGIGTEHGGLVGVNDGEVSSSFWDIDTVESGDGVGSGDGTFDATGLSTNEMKGEAAVANMDGFDFDETWTAETGDIISYPYLQSTPQDPVPGYDDTRFAGGIGSAEDPIQIETWENLHNVREHLDANFKLVGDLDEQTEGYSEFVTDPSEGFEPIGDESDPFTGTFDGGGHEISDLRIDRSEASNGKDAGLFLHVDGGVISAVGIVDGEITAADGSRGNAATDGSDATDGENGGDGAGLVLVNNGGTVDNSHVTNTTVIAGSGGAGGNGCSTFEGGCTGDDDGGSGSAGGDGGDGGDAAGVVLVSIDGTVNQTYLTGSTVAAGSGRNGGHGGDGRAEGVLSGGNGGNGGTAAGLIEYMDGEDAVITDSYVDDAIITAGSGGRGGPGYDITGTSPSPGAGGNGGAAAGIVSDISDGTVDTVYIFATNIDGGSGGSGGDGGSQHSNGSPGDDGSVGTIVVENGGTVSASYWSTDTVNQTESDGGEGLASAQMRGPTAEDNMDGFDFTDTWTAGTNPEEGFLVSLPYLQQNQQVPAPGAESLFADGNGTAENPYQIENWEHLYNVRQVLEANVTLSGDLNETTPGYETYVADPTAGFEPIGDDENAFSGTFTGSGFAISNLEIEQPETNRVGLFAKLDSGARVEHVTLESVSVEGSNIVGGLVGDNTDGTVHDSFVNGSVSGIDSVGGLVGSNRDEIHNSSTDVTITSARGGGLAGYNENGAVIQSSVATGDINGEDETGGLVGWNDGGTVRNSYATGSVDGNEDVGGLVGKNEGEIEESYAIGPVDGASDVGGLVGTNDGTVTESYWDVETTRQTNSAGGTDLTTLQMTGDRAADNMFDFGEMWAAGEADSQEDGLTVFYPVLQSNTQEPGPSTSLYDTGEGTVDNPYEIGDWYQLNYIRVSLDSHFVLTEALDEESSGYEAVAGPDANDGAGFEPIGDNDNTFTGTFNGNGHTISDLVIDQSDSGETPVGLFRHVGGDGEINNVALVNASVTGDEDQTVDNEDRTGALVGLLEGTVTNSSADATVVGGTLLGGLVGLNDGGTVSESYATGVADGDRQVGGLIGINDGGTVSESYATGEIDGRGSSGGLIGSNSGDVSASHATGEVNGVGGVGGLIGLNSGNVSTSYATGDVFRGTQVGGLVGRNDGGTVSESYATGEVFGAEFLGGLVGYNAGGNVSASYTTGAVFGNRYVAGLVGGNDGGTVSESYATGEAIARFGVGDAGLVGRNNNGGTVSASYWDTETTGQTESSGDGTGLTTIEMKGANNRLEGFDFENTWDIVSDEDVSYPFLQAIPQEPAPGLETVEDVSVSLADDEIEQGEETSFTVNVVLSESGESEATRVSSLTSSNPANATVDQNGTVTGTGVGTVTITGTYGNEEASETLTVTPGPSVAVDIDTEPANATAGEPLAGPPTVLVTDEFGNPTPGTNVSVTAVDDDSALVSGELEVETDESGIAPFDDLVIEVAEEYQLEFSIDAVDAGVSESDTATSSLFTVEPADANTVEIDSEPGDVQTAGEILADPPTVLVTDAFDNPTPDVAVSVSAVDGNGSIASGETVIETNATGIASFDDLTIEAADAYRLEFVIDGDEAGVAESVTANTSSFTVEPADANTVEIDGEPDDVQTAGEAITGPPTIFVTDEFGNPTADVAVSVSAVDGAGSIVSGEPIIETNSTGVVTFDDLVIETADEYRLAFSIDASDDGVSESETATTPSFTVEPADANTIEIDGELGDTQTAGELLADSPTVLVTDEFDNPTPGVVVSVSAVDGAGSISSGETMVETNATGIAPFDDLTIETADAYRLEFGIDSNDDGVAESETATTNSFTVGPADANTVEIDGQPDDIQTAGETITGLPAVLVTDEFDNPTLGTSVSVAPLNGAGSIASGETVVETNAIGIAMFDDLIVETADEYQLEFSIDADDDGVDESDTATSNSFAVEPADANTIEIDGEPDKAQVAGEIITDPPTVLVTDEFDNPTPDVAVSVSAVDGAGSIASGDTVVETNATGIAPFDDLVIETADAYQLEFAIDASDDGVSESETATSTSFTVEPADADSIEIDDEPDETQTAGETITGPPSVLATDEFGNPVPKVTASVTAVDGAGSIVSGELEVETNAIGIAPFDDLVIETADAYRLEFTTDAEDDGVAESDTATTNSFTVEPADATAIEIDGEPAAVQVAGEAITGPPAVLVTDEFDNPVGGVVVSVSEAGGYTFDSGTTTNETVEGVTTFDDLSIETANEGYRLNFSISAGDETVASNAETQSSSFEVTAADAAIMRIATQPAESTAGESITGPPTVDITDTFGNPVADERVTATINGSATLEGSSEEATNNTGVAVFSELSNTTADTYELTFTLTDNDAVGSTTDAFEITPAAPDTLEAANVTETAGVEGAVNVTLTDEFGNVIPEKVINGTDSGNISSLAETATTNESGVAAFGFNETTVGTYTPTFEAADTITDGATVTIEPAAPVNFDIETNGLTHTVSNDFTDDNALNVTVTLTDAFDNLVPDTPVNVTDTGTEMMVHPDREQVTDENATVAFTIQTPTAQENLQFTFTEGKSGQHNSAVLEGIEFEPALPQARGSASSYTVTPGTDVTFRAGDSTVPEGSNPQYEWEFEWNNGTEIETATGLSHTTSFDEPATINTTLTLNVVNETSTDEFTVNVEDRQRPNARLAAPTTVTAGESFSLDGTGSTDNVAIADYEWDFGNGTVRNGPTLEETTGAYAVPGEYDVTLTVTDTSGNTDRNTTTIVAEGANATLSTDPLEFGETGTSSTVTESISISNDGTTALDVTGTMISGDNMGAFTVIGEGEPRIRPGERRSLTVAFEPTAVGTKNATLEIATENNAGANSFEVELSGEGIESTLSAATSTVDFGSLTVGTVSEQNVTLRNDGTDDATLETLSLLGSGSSQFSIVDSDLPTIAAGESKAIPVRFDPQAVGEQRTTLSAETTDGDSTRVSLSGTGEGPQLNVPSTSRSAGSIGSGTETTATAELRNYGTQPLDITNLTLTGADSEAFEINTDPSQLVIGPDSSDTVELTFAPEAPGEYSTTLEVAHNDTTTDTVEIDFSGTAVGADIDIDQTTLDFGSTEVGESAVLNLTLTNEDNAGSSLTVDSTSIIGTHPEDFSVENPERPFVIEPGTERDLQINFTATEAGSREAQLQINSDSNQGQTNVWLTNTRSYIVVQEMSNPTVNIDGRNLEEGSTRMLNVSTPGTRGSAVTVDELGFEMNRAGEFEMDLSNDDAAFDNPFDADGNTDVIQYVGIDHIDHVATETFTETSLVYRVDTDSLPEDVDPDDVAIHRYDETGGEYIELDAQFIEERSGQFQYVVETPGFSEFAITVTDAEDDTPSSPGAGGGGAQPEPETEPQPDDDAPQFEVTDISLEAETIAEGETATVTATVENSGQQTGEYTLELMADGESVDSETIELEGEASTDVRLSFVPEPGVWNLELNGIDAGTVTVERSDDADEDGTGEVDEAWGLGWLLVIGGAIVLLLIVWWWRNNGVSATADTQFRAVPDRTSHTFRRTARSSRTRTHQGYVSRRDGRPGHRLVIG